MRFAACGLVLAAVSCPQIRKHGDSLRLARAAHWFWFVDINKDESIISCTPTIHTADNSVVCRWRQSGACFLDSNPNPALLVHVCA